ncbi:MAG TPA: FAD binding domain-containing protein, partial [Pseudonocardiaceae bacterium]|nr:FAD binding domain-containing protein [Pseudonocardiaceae bacterium]
MKPFRYETPSDAETAVRTVSGDPHAVFLAGGTNLVDHLKLGVAAPDRIVDVTGVTSTARRRTPAGRARRWQRVQDPPPAPHVG